MERLKKQIEFLIEIDKIKHVFRKQGSLMVAL